MLQRRSVELRRCDDRGCTPIAVVAAESGVFLNLAAPSSGYLLKLTTTSETLLDLQAGQFVEVATQMLSTYLGYGRCQMPAR